jgi:DNA-binding beta-propeller fold protein YncE
MGKLQFGGRSKGKNALRSVVALLAIVTMGGFLATNTDSIVAQQEDVEVELIVIGGTVPIIVGEFDTGSLESTQPIVGSNSPTGLAYNTAIDAYVIVDISKNEVYIVGSNGILQSQFDTSGFSTNPQGIAYNSANDRYVISDSFAEDPFFVTTAGA